jgi:hypothetical protein
MFVLGTIIHPQSGHTRTTAVLIARRWAGAAPVGTARRARVFAHSVTGGIAIVRNDHQLFIDAFRNHQIMDL